MSKQKSISSRPLDDKGSKGITQPRNTQTDQLRDSESLLPLSERGNHKVVIDEILYQLDLIKSCRNPSMQVSAAISLFNTIHQYLQMQLQESTSFSSTSFLMADSVIIDHLILIVDPSCCTSQNLFQSILCIVLLFLGIYLVETDMRHKENSSVDNSEENASGEEGGEEDGDLLRKRKLVPNQSVLSATLAQRILFLANHLLASPTKSSGYITPDTRSASSSGVSTPVKVPSSAANPRLKRKFGKSPEIHHISGNARDNNKVFESKEPWVKEKPQLLGVVWPEVLRRLRRGAQVLESSKEVVDFSECDAEEQISFELLGIYVNRIVELSIDRFTQQMAESQQSRQRSRVGNSSQDNLQLLEQERKYLASIQLQSLSPKEVGRTKESSVLSKYCDSAASLQRVFLDLLQRKPTASLTPTHLQQLFTLQRHLEVIESLCYQNPTIQEAVASHCESSSSVVVSSFQLIQVLSPVVFTSFRSPSKVMISKRQEARRDIIVKTLLQLHGELWDYDDPELVQFKDVLLLDLFIQSLKFLVSATNSCNAAVELLLGESRALDWLFALLHLSFAWKRVIMGRHIAVKDPNNERRISEIVVSLASLLINLIETVNDHFSTVTEHYYYREFVQWLKDYRVYTALNLFPSLEKSLPEPQNYLLPSPSSPFPSQSLERISELPVPFYLLQTILLETRVFYDDLIKYDLKTGPARGLLESDNVHAVGKNEGEDVPVSEIMTSSHLILLLHTLMFGKVTKDQLIALHPSRQRLTSSSQQAAPATFPPLTPLAFSICDRLPQQSFWLFLRVLKAQLALQGQCGVLSYESYLPSLLVIAHLDFQNRRIDPTALLAAHSLSEEEALAAHFESLPRANHHPLNSRHNTPQSSRVQSLVLQSDKNPEAKDETEDSERLDETSDRGSSLDWLFEEANPNPPIRKSFSSKAFSRQGTQESSRSSSSMSSQRRLTATFHSQKSLSSSVEAFAEREGKTQTGEMERLFSPQIEDGDLLTAVESKKRKLSGKGSTRSFSHSRGLTSAESLISSWEE